jgi:hypothetical protein
MAVRRFFRAYDAGRGRIGSPGHVQEVLLMAKEKQTKIATPDHIRTYTPDPPPDSRPAIPIPTQPVQTPGPSQPAPAPEKK